MERGTEIYNNLKTKDNFIFIIINCEKNIWKREKQKKDWLKDFPFNYYHIIGKENLKESFEINELEKEITVKCKDDYPSLPQKVYLALETVFSKKSFKYVIKLDDDQMLKSHYFLFKLLKKLESNTYHYGGYVINLPHSIKNLCHKDHKEIPEDLVIEKTFYCQGHFYLLSKESVIELLKYKKDFFERMIEDHTVGLLLPENLKSKMITFDTLKYFNYKL